jgi:hypothetical protein
MSYLRIERGKFWGWVVVSLLVGLGVGFGTMFLITASGSDQVRVLSNRISSLQGQLTSADASLTVLADRNAQMTLDLEAANAQIASLEAAANETTTPTPEPTITIAVTSRAISPSSVVASENVTLTMTAKVTGSPTKVVMRIYNAAKTFDHTYTLSKVSTSGDTQTWRATTKAPTVIGTYRYYATASKGDVKVTMKGVDAATLKVN